LILPVKAHLMAKTVKLSIFPVMAQVVFAYIFLCIIMAGGSIAADSVIKEYVIPIPAVSPARIAIVNDGSGDIWLTYQNENKILRFTQSDNAFKEYVIPYPGVPAGIAAAKDGTIWIANSSGNSIISFNPSTDKYKSFPIKTADSNPYDLALASSGTVWFIEREGNKIGSLSPETGVIKEYPIPTPSSHPSAIAIDKKGIVWITEIDGNRSSSTLYQHLLQVLLLSQ